MRRTAITTMLRLGMPERVVKEISGHKQSSKEFHKYVEVSKSDIGYYSNKVFQKLDKYKTIFILGNKQVF